MTLTEMLLEDFIFRLGSQDITEAERLLILESLLDKSHWLEVGHICPRVFATRKEVDPDGI